MLWLWSLSNWTALKEVICTLLEFYLGLLSQCLLRNNCPLFKPVIPKTSGNNSAGQKQDLLSIGNCVNPPLLFYFWITRYNTFLKAISLKMPRAHLGKSQWCLVICFIMLHPINITPSIQQSFLIWNEYKTDHKISQQVNTIEPQLEKEIIICKGLSPIFKF